MCVCVKFVVWLCNRVVARVRAPVDRPKKFCADSDRVQAVAAAAIGVF